MYKYLIKIRSQILVFLTHNMALPFLTLVRKPVAFPYSKNNLKEMKKGTLGNDLFNFLEQKNLQLLPYYAKHDIKHILLEYDTTDVGEVCLQCFMLGNKHKSFPVIITVLFGFFTMPEYWTNFLQAYKRGTKSILLHNWQWFEIIPERTLLLQDKINAV